MIKKEQNGVVWFEFEKLQAYPQLRHAVYSRLGGISTGPYSSLNLSYTVGDSLAFVEHNRQKLGLDVPLVQAHQVHADNVYVVTCRHATKDLISDTDALITNQRGQALAIQHADCQAAIFFDPVQKAIGCVHAGWKGSCLNIYKKTIDQMHLAFGTSPENLIVCISPSLGPDKAEFIHYKRELPKPFWQFKTRQNYFNFWEISRWQLECAGVRSENIEVAGMCTYEDAHHFFSYRRDKLCGRHLTLVWLIN